MYKVLILVCFLVTGAAVSGCTNTLDGMGRDIEQAGQSIQRSAQ